MKIDIDANVFLICNHRKNYLLNQTVEKPISEDEVVQKIINILNLESRDRIICGELYGTDIFRKTIYF